ncbi:DUF6247 family protein [Streptomyces sp. NPDC058783]|uniref:DUF6247 family protein n=1 Tax=unclassified Streptomyces TaxID=2593676 RepID=UPI00365CF674
MARVHRLSTRQLAGVIPTGTESASSLRLKEGRHLDPYGPPPLPLRTIDDVRAALLAGHGPSGDGEAFEADLRRALDGSSESDLTAVAAVLVDYRGRIRLHDDPGFEAAVQEGVDLTMRLKREAGRTSPSRPACRWSTGV